MDGIGAHEAPIGELDPGFSSPDAKPTSWDAVRSQLASAETYWLTTVRPDRRPHQTTIAGVWLDERIHFMTGAQERKAKNLAAGNRQVIVTAGCSGWEGIDVVLEGEAQPLTDADRLRRFAEAVTAKYDDFFGLRFADDHIEMAGVSDPPLVFEVRAMKVFAFDKGETFSQTRWRFGRGPNGQAAGRQEEPARQRTEGNPSRGP